MRKTKSRDGTKTYCYPTKATQIPEDLHKTIKHMATEEETSVIAVLERIVRDYLAIKDKAFETFMARFEAEADGK